MPMTDRNPDAIHNGHKIWVDLDDDGDVIKAWHFVELPDGTEVTADITPYDHSITVVRLWIDAEMPQRGVDGHYGNWDKESLRRRLAALQMGYL